MVSIFPCREREGDAVDLSCSTWGATWKETSIEEHDFEGRDCDTGDSKWTGIRTDLIFGSNSQLRAIAVAYGCADSQPAFVTDFVAAWTKAMNLDRYDLA